MLHALRSELNILDSRNVASLVDILDCRLDKENDFIWVSFLEKSWILIYRSSLTHVTIVMYCCLRLVTLESSCLTCLQAIPIKFSVQNSSQNHIYWAIFLSIGTFDLGSKLPTRIGSLWSLPTRGSRPPGNYPPELPTPHRKSRHFSDKGSSGKQS